jgi:lipopolysaccharide/colanic/teichoic acid biosynthesis glycosyltransferase
MEERPLLIHIDGGTAEPDARPGGPRSGRPRARRKPRPAGAAPRPASETHTPLRGWYAPWKRAAEYLLALALALAAAPVVFLAAAAVRLTSRGPAFYTQTRVGQRRPAFYDL